MGKIKDFFINSLNSIRNGMKRFPITLIIIAIFTIYCIITMDMSIDGILEQDTIIPFLLITIFGVFFSEVTFKNKIIKYICMAISPLISSIFVYLLVHREADFLSYSMNSGIKDDIVIVLLGYILSLAVFSIYKLYKMSELTFQKFVGRLFSNIFMISIVYGILNVGTMLLTLIFTTLLLDSENFFEIYGRIAIGLAGFFYAPAVILSMPKKDDKLEIPSFIRVLSLFVFLPLLLIGILILYLYIFKILFLNDIPSNFVYPILSAVFAVGFVIWNLISNYVDRNKIIRFISSAMPYIFIPFVILQIYCVFIRYNSYGITPARYISYLYIVLEIGLIFLMAFKKSKHIGLSLLKFIALVIIATIGPLNANSISRLNQGMRMENIISKNSMMVDERLVLEGKDTDEIEKLVSAYRYLKYEYNGEKYIPSYLTAEDKELLNTWSYYNSSDDYYDDKYSSKDNNSFYVALSVDSVDIDISKYSSMSNVDLYIYGKNDIESEEYLDYINIQGYIERLLDLYGKENISNMNYFETIGDNIIEVNEYVVFYVQDIAFNYNVETKELKYLTIRGYSFFK